jgi:hypothetical protein
MVDPVVDVQCNYVCNCMIAPLGSYSLFLVKNTADKHALSPTLFLSTCLSTCTLFLSSILDPPRSLPPPPLPPSRYVYLPPSLPPFLPHVMSTSLPPSLPPSLTLCLPPSRYVYLPQVMSTSLTLCLPPSLSPLSLSSSPLYLPTSNTLFLTHSHYIPLSLTII